MEALAVSLNDFLELTSVAALRQIINVNCLLIKATFSFYLRILTNLGYKHWEISKYQHSSDYIEQCSDLYRVFTTRVAAKSMDACSTRAWGAFPPNRASHE